MRTATWQTDFWNLLTAVKDEPFAWGIHDCATFACSVIEVITGTRPALSVAWNDKEQAEGWIEARGSLVGIVEAYLGPSVAWGGCGCGDLVLCNLPSGEALAVHDGRQLVAPSPDGLRRIPFELAVCGWRI